MRTQEMINFLNKAGNYNPEWLDIIHAKIKPLRQDASPRKYYKFEDTPYILMDSPNSASDTKIFCHIAKHLISMGLRAPICYYADHENGFILLEDFGDITFTKALQNSFDETDLYTQATKALIKLHRNPRNIFVNVPDYNFEKLRQEARLYPEWYIPHKTGQQVAPNDLLIWDELWRELYENLPPYQECLVLRDYHVDNLMVLPDDLTKQCGLLDFQDALKGHPAYDLVSLCEDARRVVDINLVEYCVSLYLQNFPTINRRDFILWYDFLGANRHAKVLGIFVRLAIRDGKHNYLQFLPHVENLLLRKLKFPQYRKIADFLAQYTLIPQ